MVLPWQVEGAEAADTVETKTVEAEEDEAAVAAAAEVAWLAWAEQYPWIRPMAFWHWEPLRVLPWQVVEEKFDI